MKLSSKYIKIFFIVALLFTSSCSSILSKTLTKKIWKPSYDETIKEFVIAQHGSQVIFLGKKYHYILEDRTGLLKEALYSKYRYLLYIDSHNSLIKYNAKGEIEADISLKLNTLSPPLDAANYFMAHGFKGYAGHALFNKLRFHGRRYLAAKSRDLYVNALSRSYKIKVTQDFIASPTIGKIALTPFALVADVYLVVARIIIWPFSAKQVNPTY